MTIQKILVCGAGIMGRGIAHAAASGGFETVLFDVSHPALQDALSVLDRVWSKGVELGKASQDEVDAAKGRLTTEGDLERAARDIDLVIEAVPESVQLKGELFSKLNDMLAPDAVFATNTSGLSITEIGEAGGRPLRTVGMHFFNPVWKMKLVELITGMETTEEAFGLVKEVAEGMGKVTVRVNEAPGFVTSRINALIGNEAFRMLESGVATAEDIDTALKLGLNHPMGPLEMADLVGLDTRLSVLEYMEKTLGDRFKPATLMRKYVAAGRLGRKVGKGVYDYDENGKRIG